MAGSLDNQLNFYYGIKADAGNASALRSLTGGISTLSDSFGGLVDKVGHVKLALDKNLGAAESTIKSTIGIGHSVEKLMGKEGRFSKLQGVLGKASLKQIAQYGILKKVYKEHDKLIDKSILGYLKYTKTLTKFKDKFKDTKEIITDTSDYLHDKAPKIIDEIIDHWEAFASAIISVGLAQKGIRWKDTLTEAQRLIKLTAAEEKHLSDISLDLASKTGVAAESYVDMFTDMYKMGLRADDQVKAITGSAVRLAQAAGMAEKPIAMTFAGLVKKGWVKPEELDSIASGLLSMGTAGAATVADLVTMGDELDSIIKRMAPTGVAAADVIKRLANAHAMLASAPIDPKAFDTFFKHIVSLDEEGVAQVGRAAAALGGVIGDAVPNFADLAKHAGFDTMLHAIGETAARLNTMGEQGRIAMTNLAKALDSDIETIQGLGIAYEKTGGKMGDVGKDFDAGAKNVQLLTAAAEKQMNTLEGLNAQVASAGEALSNKFGGGMDELARPMLVFGKRLELGVMQPLMDLPPAAYTAGSALMIMASLPVVKLMAAWSSRFIFTKGAVHGLNKAFARFPGLGEAFAKSMTKLTGKTNLFNKTIVKGGEDIYAIARGKGGVLFREAGWKGFEKGLGFVYRGMNRLAGIAHKVTGSMAALVGAERDAAVATKFITKDTGLLQRAFGGVTNRLADFVDNTNTVTKATELAAESAGRLRELYGGKSLIWRGLSAIGKAFRWVGRGITDMARHIPGVNLLGDALGAAWEFAKGFGSGILDLSRWLLKLIPGSKAVGGWLAKIWGGLGKFGSVLTRLMDTLLGPMLRGVAKFAAGLLTPIGWLLDLMFALDIAFKVIPTVGRWLDQLLGWVAESLKGLPALVGKAFDWISDLIPRAMDWIVSAIAGIPDYIVGLFSNAGKDGGLGFVTGILGSLLSISASLGKVGLQIAWGLVKTIGKGLWALGKGLVTILYELLSDVPTRLGELIFYGVRSAGKRIWEFFTGLFSSVLNFGLDMIADLAKPGNWLKAFVSIAGWVKEYIMDPVVKRFKLLWADLKVLIKELELSVEGIFGDDASYNRAAFDLKKARNEAGKLRKELTGADHEGKGIFKGARATAKALADQNAAMRQQADMARDLSSFFANWRPDRVIRAQEAGIRQFQGRMGGAAGLLGANQVASHTDVTAMPAAQPGQPAGQPAIVEVKTAPLSTLTTTSPDVVAAQEEAHGTLQDILKALDSQITVLRQIAGQSGIGPGGGTLSPTISQILNNQNARALFGHAQDPLPARALGHNAGGGT